MVGVVLNFVKSEVDVAVQEYGKAKKIFVKEWDDMDVSTQ